MFVERHFLNIATYKKLHSHLTSSVRNLGVLYHDSNLSFESHVTSICKTAFFHLKNISKLHHILSLTNPEQLVNAFMTSRLDYCSALLGGCPSRLINKLQVVQKRSSSTFLSEKGSMTTLARFCRPCIDCLLNIVYIFKYC